MLVSRRRTPSRPAPGGPGPTDRGLPAVGKICILSAAPGFRATPAAVGTLRPRGAPARPALGRPAEMPAGPRDSKLVRDLTSRSAVALVVLLISGLLAATLVRMAPGFGMDERMLDVRLGAASLQAIERQGTEHSNILATTGTTDAVIARRLRNFAFNRPAGEGTALRAPRAEFPFRPGRIESGMAAGAAGRQPAGVVAPRV